MTIKQKYASVAVLDTDYRTGSLKDNGLSAHSSTISNAQIVKTRVGRALRRTAATSVSYTHTNDFNFSNKETTLVIDVITAPGQVGPAGTATIVNHFIGGGGTAGWLLLFSNLGKLGLFTVKTPNTQIGFTTDTAINDGNRHQVVLTLSETNKLATFYVDGIAQATTLSWAGQSLVDYSVSLALHTVTDIPILRNTIYANTLLTAPEVTQLWEETQKEANLTHVPSKTSLPEYPEPSTMSLTKLGHWGMNLEGGTVYDVSGNANNATIVNVGPASAEGVFGRACDFPGTGSTALKVLASATVNGMFDTGGSTAAGWIYVRGIGGGGIGAGRLFDKASNLQCYVASVTATTFRIRVYKDFNDTDGLWETDDLPLNTWIHFGITGALTTGAEPIFYVNGEASTVTQILGPTTGTFVSDTGLDLYFGNRIDLVSAFDGTLDDWRLYDGIASTTEMQNLYLTAKYKLRYYQTGQDWNVSLATETAGFLSNTGWRLAVGTGKVQDSSNGKKEITSVTYSTYAIPSTQAFGQWEFDAKATLTATYRVAIISSAIIAIAGQLGYYFYIQSNGAVGLSRINGGSTSLLTTSSGGLVSADTWYRFKITRAASGVFSIYYSTDGGITYTLTNSTGGGTNPTAADFIYTTNVYKYLELNTGDAIRNFRDSSVIT